MFHKNATGSRRTAPTTSALYCWHDTQNGCGAPSMLEGPFANFISNYGGQALRNIQATAIKRAKDAHFSI